MSNLFIDEKLIVARPSLMKKVGVVEALLLQQLFYYTRQCNPDVGDDPIWIKLSVTEWLGLVENVIGERTMRTKLSNLEEAGYIGSRNTGELTRVKEYALLKW